MPNTYTFITSTTLTAETSVVTISSIPSTYDNLMLFVSARGTSTAVDSSGWYNSSNTTANKYSNRQFYTVSNTGYADSSLNQSYFIRYGWFPTSTESSTTFSSSYYYIPQYKNTSYNKIGIIEAVMSPRTSVNWNVNVWQDTAAITSISIVPEGSVTSSTWKFVVNSKFVLYGIKNS